MGLTNKYRARMLGTAALAIMAAIVPPAAFAEPGAPGAAITFEIEPIALGDALRQFSAQSGTPILFSEGDVAGQKANPVRGAYAPADALARLLEGTALEAVAGPGNAMLVRPSAPVKAAPAGNRRPAPETRDAPGRITAPAAPVPEAPDTLRIDSITVTGTSLRGIAPESSPLQMFSREDLLESGVTSTEEFIRTLPQNFGGGSTEFTPVGVPGDESSSYNNTFATGPNLRGLGSGATLTLLNGRRLAPTSRIGDFVDLSMIPISALERIDVLSDGASSIYGGDAVAGVMNFVLRDDFEGAETALRYGSVTSGDMEEYRFSQTLGTAWTSGNLLATYEYSGRDNLTLADRPEIAASTTFDGQRERHDLLPEQSRHSAVVAANQAFGPALKVALTGVYSDRSASNTTVATTGQLSADDVDSEFVSASLGADYDLSTRWQLSFDTTYSRIRNAASDQTLTPTVRTPTIRRTQSNLWSADLLLSGDLFEIPGGTIAGAAGTHYREERLTSDIAIDGTVENDARRTVSAVYGELGIPLIGPQNAVPGIRRLDLNLSGRFDDYSDFGTTFNPKLGALWSPLEGLNLRSTYSESFAPPALGRVGDRRRTADVYPYAFVAGGVGLQPADPALLGTDYMYVTGTGADLDPETSRTYTFGFDYQLDRGDSTWTVKSTYYDIAFDGRLGTTPLPGSLPAVFAPFIIETDPSSLPDGTVIFFPSQADVDAVLESLTRPVSFLVGSEGLDNIGVINNAAVVRNLASTETSGMDIQIDYETPTAIGAFSAGLSANYIFDFTQQASVSTPVVDKLNTFVNPVDLKIRAYTGLSHGGLSSNVFVNYLDSYRTDSTAAAKSIDAWTTVDLALSYAFDASHGAWLDGTRLNLSVNNLFDTPPPDAPTTGGLRLVGFDPTNASPLMRFVAVEVRRVF
ncbi:TonB-dependent receptor [Hyphomonas oceanitis]|uniref:TonB-dependent receptor n=1 Tax=Hyphomonas oceanitis TaxID=81033 RepID=UPI003002E67A